MRIADYLPPAAERLKTERTFLTDGPYYGRASMAGQCVRQCVYSMLLAAGRIDVPEDGSRDDLTRSTAFLIGDAIHTWVQEAVRLYDPEATVEEAWSTDLLSGHADAVYTDEDGAKVVVEAKSMSASYFHSAMAGGKPRYDHLMQAGVSAYMLNASKVHVIYICKNAPRSISPTLEWVLEVPQFEVMMAIEALEYAAQSARDGVIPARLYQGHEIDLPGDEHTCCRWCPYTERCLMDGPGVHPLELVDDKWVVHA